MTKLYDGMVLKKTFTILHIQNKVVFLSNYTGILISKYRKSRRKQVHMPIIKSPLSFTAFILRFTHLILCPPESLDQ